MQFLHDPFQCCHMTTVICNVLQMFLLISSSSLVSRINRYRCTINNYKNILIDIISNIRILSQTIEPLTFDSRTNNSQFWRLDWLNFWNYSRRHTSLFFLINQLEISLQIKVIKTAELLGFGGCSQISRAETVKCLLEPRAWLFFFQVLFG